MIQMHWGDSILWIDGGKGLLASFIFKGDELSSLREVLSNWGKSGTKEFNKSHYDLEAETGTLFEMFFDEEFAIGFYFKTNSNGLANINFRVPKYLMVDFVKFINNNDTDALSYFTIP